MRDPSKYKLGKLLAALSKIEWRQLGQLIATQPFGYPPELGLMLNFLQERYFEQGSLPDQLELLEFMNQHGRFSDQQVRLMKSYLVKCIEFLLIQKELAIETGATDVLLYHAYYKRELNDLADKLYQQSLEHISTSKLRNGGHYEHLFKLEEARYQSRQNLGRTQEFDFSQMQESFDVYYLSQKFKMGSLMQSFKTIQGKSYSDTLLNLLVSFVEQEPALLEYKVVAFYYYCYRSSLEPDDARWFSLLKDLIASYLEILPKSEQRDIILFANNFCIRRINRGEHSYLAISFQLYKAGLESGAILEKGFLSRFTFKNIVTLGIRLKEYEWTEQFIEGNQNLLEGKYRMASYAYNRAYLDYSLKNFDSAIVHLSKSDVDDELIYMASRNLLMKVYYELGYFEPLEYLFGSFSVYLRRKELQKFYKDNYKNIIDLMRKLLHIRQLTPGQRTAINAHKSKLKVLIEKTKPLTEKDWLLEQLALVK